MSRSIDRERWPLIIVLITSSNRMVRQSVSFARQFKQSISGDCIHHDDDDLLIDVCIGYFS
jgi:hypothetical protein